MELGSLEKESKENQTEICSEVFEKETGKKITDSGREEHSCSVKKKRKYR